MAELWAPTREVRKADEGRILLTSQLLRSVGVLHRDGDFPDSSAAFGRRILNNPTEMNPCPAGIRSVAWQRDHRRVFWAVEGAVIESDLKIRDCAAGTQERETKAQAAKSEVDSWSNPMHWSKSSEIPKGLGRTVTPPARHTFSVRGLGCGKLYIEDCGDGGGHGGEPDCHWEPATCDEVPSREKQNCEAIPLCRYRSALGINFKSQWKEVFMKKHIPESCLVTAAADAVMGNYWAEATEW
ncbi:hypothetical protein B0H14DRAFT_2651933 [Mycena olivaceomarginata]|nr:hypothetical protein B0H14DRAFT_2651933 [Mycena olivaceomarginata]